MPARPRSPDRPPRSSADGTKAARPAGGRGGRVAASALAALAALSGCGARSGLDLPDAQPDAAHPDAGAPDAAAPVCVELPPDTGVLTAELATPARLRVIDVLFLVDASASMRDEIRNVREGLRRIVVPAVRDAVPDAWFGVAWVGELPVEPYGLPGILPYALATPLTDDVGVVEAALDGAPVWGNLDDPEAQVEALYQAATGAGLGDLVPPSLGCARGGEGGACFRRDALPVIVLITDAPFHDGPPGVPPIAPYDRLPLGFTRPHGWDATVLALRERGIVVVGVGARDARVPSPLPHLRAIARETGAVDARGAPLVIDVGADASGTGAGVAGAVLRLAGEAPLDVLASVEDVPGDGVDGTPLVIGIRPLRAEPRGGVRAVAADRFLGVTPGTRLVFALDVAPPGGVLPRFPRPAGARRFPLRVVFRTPSRAADLGAARVELVLPDEETRCDAPGASLSPAVAR
jgi:predicted small lipoprotein YifL